MTGLPAAIAPGFEQVAWVCRDLDVAMARFGALWGVPRWYEARDAYFEELEYRGVASRSRQHVALAYAGDTQLELIQPLDGSPPGIWGEALERTEAEIVVHHVGVIVDDLAAATAPFADRGCAVVERGRLGGLRFAYVDTTPELGLITELIQPSAAIRALFARVKAGTF